MNFVFQNSTHKYAPWIKYVLMSFFFMKFYFCYRTIKKNTFHHNVCISFTSLFLVAYVIIIYVLRKVGIGTIPELSCAK